MPQFTSQPVRILTWGRATSFPGTGPESTFFCSANGIGLGEGVWSIRERLELFINIAEDRGAGPQSDKRDKEDQLSWTVLAIWLPNLL